MASVGRVDTPPNSTNVSKYIHPPTYKEVAYIAENLRQDDWRELQEGWGINPALALFLDTLQGHTVVFHVPNGKTAGIAGVSDDGCVWMLCTPAIEDYPITFIREAKRWLESLPHKVLYNCADVRNTTHLKLLKHLGFKFLDVKIQGPKNLYFVEFIRLWNQ